MRGRCRGNPGVGSVHMDLASDGTDHHPSLSRLRRTSSKTGDPSSRRRLGRLVRGEVGRDESNGEEEDGGGDLA